MDDFTEIDALRRELTQAGYEYYVLDKPTMSDYDYDHKLRRLEDILLCGRLASAAEDDVGAVNLLGVEPEIPAVRVF